MTSSSGYVKGLVKAHSKKSNDSSWLHALSQTKKAPTQKIDLYSLPLEEFIRHVSPDLTPMPHMRPLFEAMDRARYEPVKLAISIPPQHGKSTVIFHDIARDMVGPPTSVIYSTYNQDFASYQMRMARRIAERAGAVFRSDSRAICEWYLENGSVLTATGVGGSVTGKPAKKFHLDDPYKDWMAAHSRSIRDNAWDWVRTSPMTRLHPDSSMISTHTRWHPADINGQFISEGWDHINLAAINEQGEALWPEKRPIDFLEEQRKGMTDYLFSALYQGRPQPAGKEVFQAPAFYDYSPTSGYRVAIGVDFAYTSKKSSDYSVAVIMARHGESFYIVDVVRKQTSVTEFATELRSLRSRYQGVKVKAYIGGTEQGIIDMLAKDEVYVDADPALRDKFVRAQPLAAAWNAGRVLLPKSAAWLQSLVDEFRNFTGVNDPHDDMIDAAAAAFDELSLGAPSHNIAVVKPRLSSKLKGVY